MQSYKPLCWVLLGVLVVGCSLFPKQKTVLLRWHEEATSNLSEGRAVPIAVPSTGLTFSISPFASLNERDIQAAEIVPTSGGAAILVRFDPHGTFALEEMTTRSRGQHVIVFLNDRPVASWRVEKCLTNGQFLLEGDFTDAEAQNAVTELNRQSAKRK